MGQGLTAGITHLTTVNAYVAGTLRSKTPGTLGASVHLPRQLSGAALAGGNAATGISGFAFQGTNAHVILARSACIPKLLILQCFVPKGKVQLQSRCSVLIGPLPAGANMLMQEMRTRSHCSGMHNSLAK